MAKGKRGGKMGSYVSKGENVAERFNKKYNVSSLSDEQLDKIANGMVNDETTYDFDFIAIRAVEPQYAESLRPSNVWVDGEKTSQKLDGVSALETKINYNDEPEEVKKKLKAAIEKSNKMYAYSGRKPFIVIGKNAEGGEDNGELIISDPVIVDISKYLK